MRASRSAVCSCSSRKDSSEAMFAAEADEATEAPPDVGSVEEREADATADADERSDSSAGGRCAVSVLERAGARLTELARRLELLSRGSVADTAAAGLLEVAA